MSMREDFAAAYAAVWGCAQFQADALLRKVEIEYADRQNRQLLEQADAEAMRHMRSQEVAALQKEIDEWKGRESAARGAAMQIAGLLGHRDIVPFLLTGSYAGALALLSEKTREEG